MPFRTDYPIYPDAMIEGGLVDSVPHDIITLANVGGFVRQVSTINAPTPADNTTYSLTVDGITASFATPASGTTAAIIQAGIINAIRQTPLLFSRIIPSAGGSNTVILTSRQAGTLFAFTPVVSGGNISVGLTTTAADPLPIPFGRIVITRIDANDPPNGCRLINQDTNPPETVRGVSIRTNTLESRGVGLPIIEAYGNRDPVNVLRRGRIAVRTVAAVTPQNRCFVITSGADAGLVTNGGTPLPIGFNFMSSAPAGGLVILDVNLPSAGRAQ